MESPSTPDRVKTTVFIPGDLHLRLKLHSVRQRTPMGELMVAALEQYLQAAESPTATEVQRVEGR